MLGYVGYKTPEDAQKAVKYFNKTFIRMSRIGVELARPIDETRNLTASDAERTKTATGSTAEKGSSLKRKREELSKTEDAAQDPKLKEFLDVYKPKSKKAAWDNDDSQIQTAGAVQAGNEPAAVAESESDDDYEQVPKKTKRMKESAKEREPTVPEEPQPPAIATVNVESEALEEHQRQTSNNPALSDADWARSRTSRLLGLLDDEEEEDDGPTSKRRAESEEDSDIEIHAKLSPGDEKSAAAPAATSVPTPPGDATDLKEDVTNASKDVDGVRSSMRLFVRNLPFDIESEELETEFAQYGNVEEVCVTFLSPATAL